MPPATAYIFFALGFFTQGGADLASAAPASLSVWLVIFSHAMVAGITCLVAHVFPTAADSTNRAIVSAAKIDQGISVQALAAQPKQG